MDENDMKKKFFFNTKSPAYRRALEDCERVAASNVNVLLIGESGSGKSPLLNVVGAFHTSTADRIINMSDGVLKELGVPSH